MHGPIDIAQAPNGDLLIADSDGSNVDPNQPSELTEFNFAGKFVAEYPVDPNNGGAFGLNVMPIGTTALRAAAVAIGIILSGTASDGTRGLGAIKAVSMDERVRLAGGVFSIRSKPGEGTHVKVRAPLPPEKV